MSSNKISQIIPELASVGFNFPQWQEALEAAYASGNLMVVGEVEGGQVLQYTDASGAGLTILAAPPFGSFAGFADPNEYRRTSGHVSMIDSIIGVIDIVEDSPMLQVTAQSAPIIHSLTATVAQGPMIADQEPLEYQPISVSALATNLRIYPDSSEFAKSGGLKIGTIESKGLADMNSGASAPHAQATINVEVSEATTLTNELTGQDFLALTVRQLFEFTILVPVDHPDLGGAESSLQGPGAIVSGDVQFAVHINNPSACGSGSGGCGSSDCGCGGH